MHTIEFKVLDDTYRFEATQFGCDIFLNNSYYGTISQEERNSTNYWIGKGVEEVIKNKLTKGAT